MSNAGQLDIKISRSNILTDEPFYSTLGLDISYSYKCFHMFFSVFVLKRNGTEFDRETNCLIRILKHVTR